MNLQHLKQYTFLAFAAMLFMSSGDCKKAGKDCHYFISIKNNSDNQIVFTIPIHNPGGKCRLDGKVLGKGETYDYRPFNFCIERSMSGDYTREIYMVDPAFLNDDTYYDCDSIAIKNKVLKHYSLTVDDLRQLNFAVTYP